MRYRTRLLFLSAPLALLAACGSSPQENFAQAQAAFAADNYIDARKHLIAALHDAPDDKAMLALLVQTLLRMRDPDGADSAIERFKQHGGDPIQVTRYAAETALLRGKSQEALDMLGGDNHPSAWRIRGAAKLDLGNTSGAIEAFERGMAAGDDIYLMADYARVRLGMGDIEAARRIVARMQKTAPDGFETQMIIGQLAATRNDTITALKAFRKAAQRQPARFEPLLAQAEMLARSGKTDDAMKLVAGADTIAPGEPRVGALRLQLLSEKGEWTKIRDMLQAKEAGMDPRSPDAIIYGEALLRLGHTEQARMIFTRALLLSPGHRHARALLGEAQLAAGDADGAWATLAPLAQTVLVMPRELELAEKAARAAGDSEADRLQQRLTSDRFRAQVALTGNAEGATARQDWQSAIAAYRKLLDFGPDAQVLEGLAFFCSRAGMQQEAIGYVDRALALRPDDPELLNIAGWVRLEAGVDLAEAVRLLDRASDADPGNTEYAENLAKAKAAAG